MSTGNSIDAVMKSQPYSKFIVLYDRYLDHLPNSNGKLSSFWMSYLDVVEILLNLLRASREGNWELHLSTIRKMIPWCLAHDNLNYARYLSAYVSEMSYLEEEHPEAFKTSPIRRIFSPDRGRAIPLEKFLFIRHAKKL